MMGNGWGSWKDFFVLSKRDRTGLLALAALIFGTLLLPRLLWREGPPLPPVEAAVLDSLVRQMNPEGGSKEAGSKGRQAFKRPLRSFDPNTLAMEDWLALGLPERKARTILNYLGKGGRFRRPEDLQRIYGLPPAFYEAVREKIRIPPAMRQGPRGAAGGGWVEYKRVDFSSGPKPSGAPPPLELNSADSADLERLPGIGPTLARRILRFRERLGGFSSVEQLGEVWGLSDSTRLLLLPRLRLTEGSWEKLPVNSADREMLDRHPYLRGAPARLIIAWRTQHGPLLHPADLQKATGMTDSLLRRLEPYISYR